MQLRVAILIAALTAESLIAGQDARQKPRADQPYVTTTTAILVDVVVRDKRHRPVIDLKAADFEVYEDNVKQAIGSFSVVERAGGIGIKVGRRIPATTVVERGVAGTVTDAGTAPLMERPTVAIVFDALRPEALDMAQRAALAYLPMAGEGDGFVGVFASEPALRVLQNYTDDMSLVRRAVRSATAATSQQETDSERRQALHRRLNELDVLGAGSDTAVTASQGDPTAIQAIIEQQMTKLELRMLRTFESLDRDHRGYGNANALLAVVQSLSLVPGRKTLVYLSEGLPASPAMQERLETVVSAANRANVSVYTVDAAGLRAESTLVETRKEIEAAGEERLRQASNSREPTDGPLMRVVERTEDLLRLDPQGGLARLAEDTGGFLVRDTNDLSSAFRRIDEDNRFHYLLTYAPSNPEFDGKFRTIQVKVKRDGMQVFSRKGYLAVRPTAAPVLSYEAPALALLDKGRPPNAFPISATGFVFPDPKGNAAVPVVVQLRTRELQFHVDAAKNTYSAQAAVVARIRNGAGEAVQTLSQQYLLTGEAKDLDAARDGEILFYRQPQLPPGVYTLEAIVYDAISTKASARLTTLTVPPASAGRTPASALVIVRRLEQVPRGEQRADLPLYYGDMLLYPNAGEPLRRGATAAELLFYFAFYTGANDGDPAATLELLRSGAPLASIPIELQRPGTAGRIQHVGKLPIDKFPAGTYELRLRLKTGDEEQIRTAFFIIAD